MRARPLLGKIALLLGAVLVVLLALELTLRQWPTLLGHAFANGARSRYTTRAGGIHYVDRALRMTFMIPDHRATMYYNGRVWEHETDALGFRNRPLHVPADVMLVGDSVVYGHGVDFEHTLGHQLERHFGLRAANLGQQGHCAFQQAYLVTAYLPVFRPRAVVHVFTDNDIEDLYAFLADAAMRDFVAQPVERITYPPRTDPAKLLAERERRIRGRSVGRRLEEELYVMKMFRWIGYRAREWRAGVSPAEAAPRHRTRDVADPSTDPASLGWRYTEHALAYMKFLADRAGARLMTVPFVAGRQREILRVVAARQAIEFVDAPVFTGSLLLPDDGHLSPDGARVMAGLIAEAIARGPATSSAR